MKRLVETLFAPASLKLNKMVVWEVVIIISVLMGVMFYYSRQTLREEAVGNAEETLEGTLQNIDNVLLSVEQSAGNFYFDLVAHLDQPERMFTYCRRLVETNPSVVGCAIAFEPGFYPDNERFFAYVHQTAYDSPELVTQENFGQRPYTEQAWYKETMETGEAKWIDPLHNEEAAEEAFLTFSLPIYASGERDTERTDTSKIVGVMSVDLSVNLLSDIVQKNKPTPNSYTVLLGQNGTYIIHPDHDKLLKQTVYDLPKNEEDDSRLEAAKAVMSGKTGFLPFTLNGKKWQVFYKPFQLYEVPNRSMKHLNWSLGVVYPDEDIFGDYSHMLVHVLTITVIALLLFFLITRTVIRRQFKPLRKITRAANRIAAGNFKEKLTSTNRSDEIGLFQQHFQKMQMALEKRVGEQERLENELKEQREALTATLQKTQDDERVKLDFLHNISNEMIPPAETILKSVENLTDNYEEISLQQADQEASVIRDQSKVILHQLNVMLQVKDYTERKEADHE